MKLSPFTIVAIVLSVLAVIYFVLGVRSQGGWDAYPEGTIVDTPEEFNWKNTP